MQEIPVIDLSKAPGERQAWDRPAVIVFVWAAVEYLLVTNPLQISSRLRVAMLKLFGARIGKGVVFRPRTRVKFPWKLEIGDRCWIGEGVWFHNQNQITIGHDSVISQESLLTTGSHALRKDMSLITRPIVIEPGVWITTRCIVLGGSKVGRSAVVAPGTLVRGSIPANSIYSGETSLNSETRFPAP